MRTLCSIVAVSLLALPALAEDKKKKDGNFDDLFGAPPPKDNLDAMKKATEGMGAKTAADPLPEEKIFYRSDHFAFVRKGVPALMMLGGPAGDVDKWMARAKAWMDSDYHQPGDVVRPDWDWSGARTIAAIGLVIGLRVANADAMPQWIPSAPFSRPAAAAKPS